MRVGKYKFSVCRKRKKAQTIRKGSCIFAPRRRLKHRHHIDQHFLAVIIETLQFVATHGMLEHVRQTFVAKRAGLRRKLLFSQKPLNQVRVRHQRSSDRNRIRHVFIEDAPNQ